jgi:uncharacterized GH25 family protein
MQRVLVAFFVAAPAAALAHDTWLLPARWNVPVRDRVVVDLTSAMDFPRPETAVRVDRLLSKSMRLNGTVTPLDARPPGAKALQLSAVAVAPGLATVWMTTRPRTLDLKPDEVKHYLEEVGAWDTIGEQWRRSADQAWRETYVKVAKTFIRIGDAQEDRSWTDPVGASLEIVPASDPTGLVEGQELSLQLLWNGRPIADLAVGAVAAAPAKAVLLKTDPEGRVALRLDRPGPWLLRATLIRPVADQAGTWVSTFTTLTIEVKPR